MNFEFDPKKSASNKLKRGLSLEESKALWYVLSVIMEAKTVDEPRFLLIGKVKGKCYSCVYTMRGDVVRLISARRSRKSEEEIYYEHIK